MPLTLQNDNFIAVLSELGATLDRLYDVRSGLEHVWAHEPSIWPRRTHVCFPVCGKLLDGEYRYDSKSYTMPMHGFLREKTFDLTQSSKTRGTLQFHSDESTLAIYPFDFLVAIDASLDDAGLTLGYEIRNTGNLPLPYSIGSHYSYKVPITPGETSDDYQIDFLAPQNAGKIILTDGYITGKSNDIFKGNSLLPLKGLVTNGAVALELSELSTRTVTLRSAVSGRHTTVSLENFDYLLLWAPRDGAPFLCIEAWAGVPDTHDHDKVLEHKKGIHILAPNGTNSYKQRIITGLVQSK